jgi:ribosomal protein S20
MVKGISLAALIMMSIASLLLLGVSNSVAAQNTTNQTTTSINMTNATASAVGGSIKTHLEESIKALEGGDIQSASTHLTAAQQAISGASDQAKMHFNEGMKAFSAGDTNGALIHLKAADQALG